MANLATPCRHPRAVKTYAIGILGGKEKLKAGAANVRNEDTGWNIRIDYDGFVHSTWYGKLHRESPEFGKLRDLNNVALGGVLPELLRNAVRFESEPKPQTLIYVFSGRHKMACDGHNRPVEQCYR